MTKYHPKRKAKPPVPGLETLGGQVRGFCTTPEARKALLSHGLPAKAVYQEGIGAETMIACLCSYRERPGWLVLAQDLTAFGPSKREVASMADTLEKAGIRLLDITNPNDQTYAAMVQRANVIISGSRFRKNRKEARRIGQMGGTGKGVEAERKRNEIAPAWLIDRLVDAQHIAWRDKLDLLHPHFTEATLRRHYGVKAALRRA